MRRKFLMLMIIGLFMALMACPPTYAEQVAKGLDTTNQIATDNNPTTGCPATVAASAAVSPGQAKMFADQAAASVVKMAKAPVIIQTGAAADQAAVPTAKAEACLVKKTAKESGKDFINQMKMAIPREALGKAVQAQDKVKHPFVKSLFVATGVERCVNPCTVAANPCDQIKTQAYGQTSLPTAYAVVCCQQGDAPTAPALASG